MGPTTQILRSAEALTMPGVQVIVLNANMCCPHCRDRVSKVLSKMGNLLDYVVDVRQKKVAVRGRVDHKKRMRQIKLVSNEKRRKVIEFDSLISEGESTDSLRSEGESTDLLQPCNSKLKSTDSLIQWTSCFRCVSS